ncbi:MAG: phosphoserine phosphatase, partial [Caldanaerobacter sp.]
VSDGYDFIINAVFEKYNLTLPYYSNKMWFEDGKIKVAFPYKDEVCDKCGMCKLNILKKYKGKGYRVAFVGDGYSDFCVVEYADEVFAKDVLANYCLEKGIGFYRFENFKDIVGYIL